MLEAGRKINNVPRRRYIPREDYIGLIREIFIKDTRYIWNLHARTAIKGGSICIPANCLNSCDSTTFHCTILVMNTMRYLHSSVPVGIINRDTSRTTVLYACPVKRKLPNDYSHWGNNCDQNNLILIDLIVIPANVKLHCLNELLSTLIVAYSTINYWTDSAIHL